MLKLGIVVAAPIDDHGVSGAGRMFGNCTPARKWGLGFGQSLWGGEMNAAQSGYAQILLAVLILQT